MTAARRRYAAALAGRIAAGERGALARAISLVENRRPGFQELMARLAGVAGGAFRTGVTGPPGAGKSTLVGALARRHREEGEEVAVIAVDPTSPYSGGALLGDRVRMPAAQSDPGIFIRSMATRAARGGLSEAVYDVCDLMDGCGFAHILLETVGVGQTELGIADAADSVVVVLTPESGDEVQALKAGLTEVADIFVVNKADRPGASFLVRRLREALRLRRDRHRSYAAGGVPGWDPPVLSVVATTGEGIDALAGLLGKHRRCLTTSGALEARRRVRAQARVSAALQTRFNRYLAEFTETPAFREALRSVVARDESVYEAAARLWSGERLPVGERMSGRAQDEAHKRPG